MKQLLTWWNWVWPPTQRRSDQGSVTIENIIWALAVIVIAAIVIAAITTYVTTHSNELLQ